MQHRIHSKKASTEISCRPSESEPIGRSSRLRPQIVKIEPVRLGVRSDRTSDALRGIDVFLEMENDAPRGYVISRITAAAGAESFLASVRVIGLGTILTLIAQGGQNELGDWDYSLSDQILIPEHGLTEYLGIEIVSPVRGDEAPQFYMAGPTRCLPHWR